MGVFVIIMLSMQMMGGGGVALAVVIGAWWWLLGQCCSMVAINTSGEEKEKRRKYLLVVAAMNTPGQAVMAIDTAKLKEKRRKEKKKLATSVDMERIATGGECRCLCCRRGMTYLKRSQRHRVQWEARWRWWPLTRMDGWVVVVAVCRKKSRFISMCCKRLQCRHQNPLLE